ncbi:MAG: ABC transporter ATP-binding protein [Chloroflexi bacterium]|nr:ABC transporter ATP-binding protein [Chloroflexota bacterium]MCL5275222.1 ABC transporter ATP-binding protein [Chloroflexota bacterium]
MTNDNNVLIEVRNLQTYFYLYEGTVRAVDGVSYDIRKGKSLGVIGESGCGKSVTAQSTMRIVPSPPGKEVGGEIIMHLEKEPVDVLKLEANSNEMRAIRWKEISMIFQEPMTSFSPLFTIGNQIVEAIKLHLPGLTKKEMRERTIELLDKVGIPQPSRLIDVYPHQLSGGMRQRAMIAMALSCNPKLLIADEPTTALDVTIEAQILELIRGLQEEFGMALMYISHDLAVVSEMSDEIMVMYLGRVMEKASTDEIFNNPLHPYTRALWRSIPVIEGELKRLETIKGVLPNPYQVQKGCPFFSRCEQRMPGLCDEARPPLYQVTPTQTVSCFLYDKNAKAGPAAIASQSVATS